MKKLKKKPAAFLAIVVLLAVLLVFSILIVGRFQKAHTFKLSSESGDPARKTEQIQPVNGTVHVRGDADTDVEFTDMETGKSYVIGYLTHGMSERIKLEKGKWYAVRGGGNLTVRPVNVRIVEDRLIQQKKWNGFP